MARGLGEPLKRRPELQACHLDQARELGSPSLAALFHPDWDRRLRVCPRGFGVPRVPPSTCTARTTSSVFHSPCVVTRAIPPPRTPTPISSPSRGVCQALITSAGGPPPWTTVPHAPSAFMLASALVPIPVGHSHLTTTECARGIQVAPGLQGQHT